MTRWSHERISYLGYTGRRPVNRANYGGFRTIVRKFIDWGELFQIIAIHPFMSFDELVMIRSEARLRTEKERGREKRVHTVLALLWAFFMDYDKNIAAA